MKSSSLDGIPERILESSRILKQIVKKVLGNSQYCFLFSFFFVVEKIIIYLDRAAYIANCPLRMAKAERRLRISFKQTNNTDIVVRFTMSNPSERSS